MPRVKSTPRKYTITRGVTGSGGQGYMADGRIVKLDSLKLIGTIDGRRILVIEPGDYLDQVRWSSAKVDWRGPYPQATFTRFKCWE